MTGTHDVARAHDSVAIRPGPEDDLAPPHGGAPARSISGCGREAAPPNLDIGSPSNVVEVPDEMPPSAQHLTTAADSSV